MTSRSVICYIGFLFVIWQYGEANVVEEYDDGLLTILAPHSYDCAHIQPHGPPQCTQEVEEVNFIVAVHGTIPDIYII